MTVTDLTKPGAGQPADPAELTEAPPRIGANDLGRIDVETRAVEKIAALAALEVPDAGGSPRGRAAPGNAYLGLRRSAMGRLPRVKAEIEGDHVFLDVELSVRWPLPISGVTEAVRQHLFLRVSGLLGLEVREVNIEVVDLLREFTTARVS
jgi:uncharacterized alkaline shock family protein YloU